MEETQDQAGSTSGIGPAKAIVSKLAISKEYDSLASHISLLFLEASPITLY